MVALTRLVILAVQCGCVPRTILRELDNLSHINSDAVAAGDWRAPEIKKGNQTEVLVNEWFP
jgi:hypothetical protein